VQSIISSVMQSSNTVLSSVKTVKSSFGKVVEGTTTVQRNSTENAENISLITRSLNEMSGAAKEISQQISFSSSQIQSASGNMDKTREVSNKLFSASKQIEEIVLLIMNISAEINLLALNATIEAARAGDAGKGFAVVADEVKKLASQTSKASESITEKVNTIQGVSNELFGALENVNKVFVDIEHSSTSIASAIVEQTVSTEDINNKMKVTEENTTGVVNNLVDVSRVVSNAMDTAEVALNESESLAGYAQDLNKMVNLFLENLEHSNHNVS
jgi:methyl-accepting chemotaxis protein